MTSYIGIVDKGGEGYGVWFPDLRGCTSGGKTFDDLFRMAIEAVALWAADARADNETLPPAREIDALVQDPDVKRAMAGETPVVFLPVPLVLETNRSVRANLSIDAGLLEAIDAAADRVGQTRSAFLTTAAREKIARY